MGGSNAVHAMNNCNLICNQDNGWMSEWTAREFSLACDTKHLISGFLSGMEVKPKIWPKYEVDQKLFGNDQWMAWTSTVDVQLLDSSESRQFNFPLCTSI